MKAVTVQPGVAGSVRFEEVPEPDESTGSILVEAVAVGICGTDVEITSGEYGWAPPAATGSSSATSRSAGSSTGPEAGGLQPGDLIVGSSAAPTRCRARTAPWASGTCAATGSTPSGASSRSTASCPSAGESSRATSPSSTPHSASSAVLLEPTTVVAKAWELVAAMRARAFWEPRTVLVTGAGPIGMLAALIGVQHGLDVHVLDRVTRAPSPSWSRRSAPRTTPGPSPTSASTPTWSSSAPGSAGDRRLDPRRRRRRRRLPHRCGQRWPGRAGSRRPMSPSGGPAEQRRRRLGQRQPAPLLPGRRGARRAPTATGSDGSMTRRVRPEHIPDALDTRTRRHQGRRRLRSLTMVTDRAGTPTTAGQSPAPPSRPSSVRASGGTPAATNCWRWTSWPDGSPAACSARTACSSASGSTAARERSGWSPPSRGTTAGCSALGVASSTSRRRHPSHRRRGGAGRDPDERRGL